MNTNEISGKRQMEFLAEFDYIREAGTAGEEKAAKIIQETLNSFGVENHLEEFGFETFQVKKAKLTITEPYVKEYTVTGYGRCSNTDENGQNASFLYVENADEISLANARGKIVMVNDPVRKELYQKLANSGVAGFISIAGSPLDEGVDLTPRAYSLPKNLPGEEKKAAGKEAANYDNRTPGVSIHYKDAVELVTRGAAKACLSVEQETVARTSRNVVARIKGTDKAEEILTLTAHYDSVPEGPGAYDNMSGAAIIMELCRYFKEHRPRRTMEFVWFGAEEKGLLGSQNYIKEHESELQAHRFNMNVDLAGQLVGGTVVGVTGDASICNMISSRLTRISRSSSSRR